MTKRIAENDLAQIYFNGDQTGLEKLLDRVYGEGFFENNQILLETIHYSSDTGQILELTNEIMTKIGGELLRNDRPISPIYNKGKLGGVPNIK